VNNLILRTVVVAALALACVDAPVVTAAAQPPKQAEEYVPISQLPPEDQLPAAPLLVGAYVFVPIVLFLYLLSVARRTSAVQREIERLETDLKRSSRA
jgi:CcmD family protein